jgi:hypothetical protein
VKGQSICILRVNKGELYYRLAVLGRKCLHKRNEKRVNLSGVESGLKHGVLLDKKNVGILCPG